MRPLKFESCLSVPNEPRLDKNVSRLHPDIGDGATNSADSSPDSSPTLPRLTPESSACIFLPVPRVSHEWAPTYPTALRTTPTEPRCLPTLPRRSHESCWISLIRLASFCMAPHVISTVAQTRHVISLFYNTICSTLYYLLHTLLFAPHFIICSTLYYLLHTLLFAPHFIICSTLLQFALRFYNLLFAFTIDHNLPHTFIIDPHFYNDLHYFIFFSTFVYVSPHCYDNKSVEQIVKVWSKL